MLIEERFYIFRLRLLFDKESKEVRVRRDFCFSLIIDYSRSGFRIVWSRWKSKQQTHSRPHRDQANNLFFKTLFSYLTP